jgi:hypothetical protein
VPVPVPFTVLAHPAASTATTAITANALRIVPSLTLAPQPR